ncbi:hypothetical protein T459_20814 [Capsicum annuum]|uniref:Pentacotripeptide-repeat region of PRORP domain-containing protein n=1 Tax=Capsicum annuum TaxID=4072 RepID=A0A2G2Z5K2_CAPAN|nr:hypothetical protein T459_20814 [Capsicum annuum]
MPGSKSKTQSSLFRSASKLSKQWKSASPKNSAVDIALKNYVSSKPLSEIAAETLKFNSHGESPTLLSRELSSIFCGDLDSDLTYSEESSYRSGLENVLDVPWLANEGKCNTSARQKVISRERKEKWTFKNTEISRFHQLVNQCGCKLGADTTIKVFGKLGRETGMKEYNSLIKLCIERARETNDEEVSLQQLSKAYQLLKSMTEQGFPVEEESYGPILMYFVDYGMVQEFDFYCELIIDRNADSLARLAYYEMLLWTKVQNEDKIEELLYHLSLYDGTDKSVFQENYLLALCESNRVKDFERLLQTIDTTTISSNAFLTNIFKFLGKYRLESSAVKLLPELVTSGNGEKVISNFIYTYTTSIPSLAVEDIILEFKNLHAELELKLASSQYHNLIKYCCELFKVHAALDMVDQMFEGGMKLSLETLNSILEACDKSCEYQLFEGAYGMLKDLEKFNVRPTPGMYNAIMAGYFREIVPSGRMVESSKWQQGRNEGSDNLKGSLGRSITGSFGGVEIPTLADVRSQEKETPNIPESGPAQQNQVLQQKKSSQAQLNSGVFIDELWEEILRLRTAVPQVDRVENTEELHISIKNINIENKTSFEEGSIEKVGEIMRRKERAPKNYMEQQTMLGNSCTGGELWNVEEATPIATAASTDIIEMGKSTSAWVRQNIIKLGKMFGADFKGHEEEVLELLMQVDACRQARRLETSS